MGCGSSLNDDNLNGAGDINSTKCPLNREEIKKLRESWHSIRGKNRLGVFFFVKLFTNTELNHMFAHLVTEEGRVRSEEAQKQLEGHAGMVVFSIGESFKALNDPPVLLDLTKRIGVQHKNMDNFKPAYFWSFENPMLEGVKGALKNKYTPEMELLYKKAARYVLKLMYMACLKESMS